MSAAELGEMKHSGGSIDAVLLYEEWIDKDGADETIKLVYSPITIETLRKAPFLYIIQHDNVLNPYPITDIELQTIIIIDTPLTYNCNIYESGVTYVTTPDVTENVTVVGLTNRYYVTSDGHLATLSSL